MKDIVEIRWHGRGGQGAKTASLLLADAAFNTGKYVQGFPEYGPERMGAPMRSGPYSGKPWTYLPVLNAASASSSDAVLAPWPPRPCHRISTMSFMLDPPRSVWPPSGGRLEICRFECLSACIV